VLALVTRPIADGGKRRKTAENPTRDLGQSVDLPILDPADANDDAFVASLRELHADVLVVCDYGQILSPDCLGAARLGGINLHGSLLPRYRGAAPVQWSILSGDTVTGVTIIHMTPRLDGGPCLVQRELAIDPLETAADLEPRLADLGVGPVHEALELLAGWDGQAPLGQPQDPHLATRAPRLKKSDGEIDWCLPASQIVNQVRAYQPWPGSFTQWSPPAKGPQRLILLSVRVEAEASAQGFQPGQVIEAQDSRLIVQTGQGQLRIEQLQPAGKRTMPTADFLRGQSLQSGDRLG
jgi:methionyl-tRNA formyltransferase